MCKHSLSPEHLNFFKATQVLSQHYLFWEGCVWVLWQCFFLVIFDQEKVKETNDCSLALLPQLFPLPLKCKQQLSVAQSKHLLSLDKHFLYWKSLNPGWILSSRKNEDGGLAVLPQIYFLSASKKEKVIFVSEKVGKGKAWLLQMCTAAEKLDENMLPEIN